MRRACPSGLDRFLRKRYGLVNIDGQIVLDPEDPGESPAHNRAAREHADYPRSKYRGEVRLRLEHKGKVGSSFESLYIVPATLGDHAIHPKPAGLVRLSCRRTMADI